MTTTSLTHANTDADSPSRRFVWRLRALSALVGLLSLFAAFCSSPEVGAADTPGITPTNVLIGSDQPLSGPASFGYGEIAPASRAFFDYVNAHGGVNGRTITYTYLDDGDVPAQAVADEDQLVAKDHVFAIFNAFGFSTHAAVVQQLNAERVPDLFVGSSCACWNEPRVHPDTFGFGGNYDLEGRLLGSYVASAFPAHKIGYIWEDDSCCQKSVTELNREIPASSVVSEQPFTIGDLSAASELLPQVKAVQASGAQLLVLDTLAPAAVAEVLLDASRIGYHPEILDTFRLSADPATVAGWIGRLSGGNASPDLENGLVTQDYLPASNDTANAWITLFRKIHDAYEPNEPFDNMTVYGMAAAYTFTRALEHAGTNPTRRSIVAAIDSGAVNSAGPGLVQLDDSAQDHDGYPGEEIGTVQNGGIVLSGPVRYVGRSGKVAARPAITTSPPRTF
jgi:ABC-type branched-subunit amino acid transport system substrate-binding protein